MVVVVLQLEALLLLVGLLRLKINRLQRRRKKKSLTKTWASVFLISIRRNCSKLAAEISMGASVSKKDDFDEILSYQVLFFSAIFWIPWVAFQGATFPIEALHSHHQGGLIYEN